MLTYTITVTNNGPSDAQDVSLADTLDPALTGETWTLDTVAQGPWTGTALLGTMAPSTHHVIVITATVNPATPDTAVITNTATSTSTTDDPCDGIGEVCDNNSATETTDVDTEADLSISKSGPPTATAGDPAGFDYTIAVAQHRSVRQHRWLHRQRHARQRPDVRDRRQRQSLLGNGSARDLRERDGSHRRRAGDSFIVHVTLDRRSRAA